MRRICRRLRGSSSRNRFLGKIWDFSGCADWHGAELQTDVVVRKMLYCKDFRLDAGVFVGVAEGSRRVTRGQMILKLVTAPAASGLPARSATPVFTKDRV